MKCHFSNQLSFLFESPLLAYFPFFFQSLTRSHLVCVKVVVDVKDYSSSAGVVILPMYVFNSHVFSCLHWNIMQSILINSTWFCVMRLAPRIFKFRSGHLKFTQYLKIQNFVCVYARSVTVMWMLIGLWILISTDLFLCVGADGLA